MILPCTCTHEAQDKIHGKGRRVWNVGKTHRKCTVCGAKVALSSSEMKEAKDNLKKEEVKK